MVLRRRRILATAHCSRKLHTLELERPDLPSRYHEYTGLWLI
jgi:hypothetical protein